MRRSGYVVKRLAVAPQAVATIRRNALAQAREPPAPAWRKWLGLEKELKEGVNGGPHGRLLIPLAPDDDGVGDVLTKALAAVGTDAVGDAGLSEDALLVELSVLAVLPRAAAQPPHLDVLPRDGLAMATLFVPLQDVSERNGATVLYPAPPSDVAARRDWALLHKSENRTYAPDGAEDDDAAAVQAAAAGLLPPVASPWSKFSSHDLGLGEPLILEMRAGDVALWYLSFPDASRVDDRRFALSAARLEPASGATIALPDVGETHAPPPTVALAFSSALRAFSRFCATISAETSLISARDVTSSVSITSSLSLTFRTNSAFAASSALEMDITPAPRAGASPASDGPLPMSEGGCLGCDERHGSAHAIGGDRRDLSRF